jgi:hypothetical protein
MRTHKFLTLAALTATLALPAVAATAPTSATAATSAETSQVRQGPGFSLPYPIRIVRTGGPTVRLYQLINIATNGQWWYSERRRGVFIPGKLSPWQIVVLRRLELDPALPGVLGPHPPPLGCANAFRYEVTLAWWQPVSTYADCGNPPAPLARLVNAVARMTAF